MVMTGLRNSGSSVIELLVTVAAMLVLLMTAVPSFEGMRLRAALGSGAAP